MASTGRDIRMDSNRVEGYRNFCNKIWNAARYVLMNTENQDNGLGDSPCRYSQADLWITSRLQQVIATTTEAIEHYRFDLAAQALYEFTWNEYCDWYLELAKISLQNENAAEHRGTRKTLLTVLENILRLSHPLMPFITEEIWQRIAPLTGTDAETIMLQPYPITDASQINQPAMDATDWLMQFILGVRRIRGEQNIAPGKPLNVLLQNGTETDRNHLKNTQDFLLKLGRLETITWLGEDDQAPDSAIAPVGKMEILIPLAGLIDKKAEIARLEKEIQKIQKELPRIEAKLSNPSFIDRAPKEVVDKEKSKLEKNRLTLQQLQEQLFKINKM